MLLSIENTVHPKHIRPPCVDWTTTTTCSSELCSNKRRRTTAETKTKTSKQTEGEAHKIYIRLLDSVRAGSYNCIICPPPEFIVTARDGITSAFAALVCRLSAPRGSLPRQNEYRARVERHKRCALAEIEAGGDAAHVENAKPVGCRRAGNDDDYNRSIERPAQGRRRGGRWAMACRGALPRLIERRFSRACSASRPTPFSGRGKTMPWNMASATSSSARGGSSCGCRVSDPLWIFPDMFYFHADGEAKRSLLEARIKVPCEIGIERSWAYRPPLR